MGTLDDQNLNQVINSLPQSFPFYNGGRVEMTDQLSRLQLNPAHLPVAFRIYGDLEAWILILFDPSLDVSTYSELGNILVSQVATQLSVAYGLGVLVSPPYLLAPSQAQAQIVSSPQVMTRSYVHVDQNGSIPISAWILAIPSGEVAHA